MSSTIATVTETASSTATASSTILAVPVCYNQWFHPQSCLAAKIEAGITFALVGIGILLVTVFLVLQCAEYWVDEKREERRRAEYEAQAQARGGHDEEMALQDGYYGHYGYRL